MKERFANANPIWLREMRQAARLTRTPMVLAGLTVVLGLTMSSVGGVASANSSPAEVGSVLFHTFFSIAFAIVSWIGPGVAALTVVSERIGRTWEAVVLTGLAPRRIASGKLLAALTYLGLYIVALAPVGALPFLFGGVRPVEVFAAFVILGVFALVSVSFGLAVSSGAKSTAVALLTTLPLAFGMSMATYFVAGVGGSYLAHERWPGIEGGPPIWLPTAYLRAELGVDYVVYLVVVPLALTVVFVTYFFELAVANLSDESDDRASGLKVWFVFASAVVTALGIVLPRLVHKDSWGVTIMALALSALLSLMGLFVLAEDLPAPPRRVVTGFARSNATALRRFLGPGIARTAALLFATAFLSQGALAYAGVLAERSRGASGHGISSILIAAGYALSFLAFLSGLAVFVRSRPIRRFRPRTQLALAVFAAMFGPLFLVAIAGFTGAPGGELHRLAAPSPLYAFYAIGEKVMRVGDTTTVASAASMAGWTLLGVLLGGGGLTRLRARAAAERAAAAVLDARLRAEDEASAGETAAA
jgi:hypothetical protein